MAFRNRCEDVHPLWRQTLRTGPGGHADQEGGRGQIDQSNHGNDQPSDPIYDLMIIESDSDISIELDDYLAGMNLGRSEVQLVNSYTHVILIVLLFISFSLLLLPLPFTLLSAFIRVSINDPLPVRVIAPVPLIDQSVGDVKLPGKLSIGGAPELLLLTKCKICKAGVTLIQGLMLLNSSEREIADGVRNFCIKLKIEDQRVCTGLVQEYKREVLYLLDNVALSPELLCGIVKACKPAVDPLPMWNVTFPSIPKPPVLPPRPPPPGSPTMRVLHIADIHIDFEYTPGSEADCGEPVCCRKSSPPGKGVQAGNWGVYSKCDTPVWTLENMFQHLSKNEKFDYIIWTGDTPGHNIWNQTHSSQLHTLKYITTQLLHYFPSTPIYPALGNHESSPVNSYPPPFIQGDKSITWLYTALAKSWTNWLPLDTVQNISRGGFYTAPVKPGLRVVSLNMNYCNSDNWWLILNTTDPANELQWLISVLQESEKNREKVHIIGHIPPGHDSCLKAWSWNYYRIINRYESTVVAQFFGHTHFDHLEIFYDTETLQRALSVAYIGPSVTTYENLNPGYRVYTVEGQHPNSTWAVLDHETYIMNLTEANLSNKPQWIKEYSAKETYGLSSLAPADWDHLVQRMNSDDAILQTFYRLYWKSHSPTTTCDHNCKKQYLCEIKTGRSHDSQMCRHFNVSITEAMLYRKAKTFC